MSPWRHRRHPHEPEHARSDKRNHERNHEQNHDTEGGPARTGIIRAAGCYHWATQAAFFGQRGRVYSRLAARAAATPGERVLDLGCGTGALTRAMAAAVGPAGSVLGIDPSAEMVAFAGQRPAPASSASCRYRVMSAERLDLPDASIDVVVSALAVHHIAPRQRITAGREAFRVLRPGGRIMVADFRPPSSAALRAVVGRLTSHGMDHDPDGDITAMLEPAGFTIRDRARHAPVFHVVLADRP